MQLKRAKTIDIADPFVTADQVKAQAYITHDLQEAHLELYLDAAVDYAEQETGLALKMSEYTLTADALPMCLALLPRPLHSLEKLEFKHPDDGWVSVDLSDFYIDRTGTGALVSTRACPEHVPHEGVRATFTCGFGKKQGDKGFPYTLPFILGPHYDVDEPVPKGLRLAVLMLAAHFYEHREAASDFAVHEVPMGAQRLLDQNAELMYS